MWVAGRCHSDHRGAPPWTRATGLATRAAADGLLGLWQPAGYPNGWGLQGVSLDTRLRRLENAAGRPDEIAVAFFDCPTHPRHRLVYVDGREEAACSREAALQAIRGQGRACKVYIGLDIDQVCGRKAFA
jgi:hypothetical protein